MNWKKELDYNKVRIMTLGLSLRNYRENRFGLDLSKQIRHTLEAIRQSAVAYKLCLRELPQGTKSNY